MPVQFVCPKCNQLLSVGSRKIGTEVSCPRCQRPVVVPTREAAAVGLALRRSSREQTHEPPLAEFIVYDDIPSVNDEAASVGVAGEPPQDKAPPGPTGPPTYSSDAPLWLRTAPREFPNAMLLLSRRGVYMQGVLLAVTALLALLAGMAIGYGLAPASTDSDDAASPGEVVLEGVLEFTTEQGQTRGDRGAVVIAVPDQNIPDPKLPVGGLRPVDDAQAASAGLTALERVGGALARADADGRYRLTVERPGRYLVAMISRHAERPPTAGIDEFELAVMKRYFDRPEQLVGRSKFVWKLADLSGGTSERSHNFGPSGE